MTDRNISPIGWYLGSYLIRFIETKSTKNNDPEERFLSWENTVLIRANNLDEAYEKVVAIGNDQTEPYLGGPDGTPVQWVFEGITDLLPIYEQLEDGAEIAWAEHAPRKLKNLQKMVRQKDEFKQ